MEQWKEKLRAGSIRLPVTIRRTNGRLEFEFPFNRPLMEEIKVMEGSKYHGYDAQPRKLWSVADSIRNRFQLEYLAGRNPYAPWDKPLVEVTPNRSCLYTHQKAMLAIGLTYHYAIWAAEMGTGKTLAAIELMEASGFPDWIWVGPKSALAAVKLEFETWKTNIRPIFMTYEYLVKVMTGWQAGVLPPHGVIFDESSRLKNHITQRSQAAQHIADAIRATWGERGFLIEMSGSPSPGSPVDWWSQCEIACPGYLREGRVDKFRNRLALYKQEESLTGGMYPKLVTWWDDETKCKHCGKAKDHPTHDLKIMGENNEGYHQWEASKNEVSYLYQRMKGLVHVFFKKDCLDLPEKRYRSIFCPPTREIMNSMKTIVARCGHGIKALTLLRELSDGFQYQETEDGTEVCENCKGRKTTLQQFYVGPDFTPEELATVGVQFAFQHPEGPAHPEWWKEEIAACPNCKGLGEVTRYIRTVAEVPCPKEDALLNIFDEHEDIGRIVTYGGFTGSVDRIVRIAQKAKWHVIRVDGRGWHSDLEINGHMLSDPTDLLKAFQRKDYIDEFARVCFVGQPGAAGMGLTLTASPTIVYYSNDFNAESRIQSEDRIHRPGMDVNRGATIIDLLHLPSDKLVLDNLKAKRDLQSLTMGQMKVMLDLAMENKVRMV